MQRHHATVCRTKNVLCGVASVMFVPVRNDKANFKYFLNLYWKAKAKYIYIHIYIYILFFVYTGVIIHLRVVYCVTLIMIVFFVFHNNYTVLSTK